MPELRFSVTDPTAFLEIAEIVFRHCKAGERVAIEVPLKGCADYLGAWQQEQRRLFLKMSQPPNISITVNQSGVDKIIVRTETEAMMNKTIIKNIVNRIVPHIKNFRELIPDSDDGATTAKAPEAAVPLNILYSGLKDCLTALNLEIRSLDAGSDVTNNIKSVTIWPQTEDALQFIIKSSRYGSTLETGIRRLIQNGSNQWPLLKAAPNMPIELHFEKHPEHEADAPFHIEFDWGTVADTVPQSRLRSVPQASPIKTAGKRRLQQPLTIIVETGATPTTHEITHVPCRINRLTGDWSEISLNACGHVSGNHIVIDLLDGQLVLVDQNSKHGTFTSDGRDLRQMPGSKCLIRSNSRSEFFLCFGKPEQVERNRKSDDRQTFPRLLIEYGMVTPEIGQIDGTPELDCAANS